MVENAELLRMTEAELKIIWDASNLEDSEIKPIFGFSRSTLYNRFDDEVVSIEIETAVDKHPILSQWKDRVLNKTLVKRDQTAGAEVVQLLSETLQVMKDVMKKGEKQAEVMEKMAETLISSNTRIGLTAELILK